MRICDYIFNYLERIIKLERVYTVPAGGCSGLQDGLTCNKNIQTISLHGEGPSGYAAIGDSKYTNKLSCVVAGTGCCNSGLATSILTAWTDSVPLLIILGDCNSNQLLEGTQARNFGVQGNNPIELYKSITKFAVTVKNKDEVSSLLQKCIYECLNGRRGPCILNIPTDLQTAEILIDNKTLVYAGQIAEKEKFNTTDFNILLNYIKESKRPVLLVGNGARFANKEVEKFSEVLKIPIVSSYGAQDFLRSPNYVSTSGTKAERSGNFILHQSDLVIILGSSLNVSLTGYNFSLFAPQAKHILCDIDEKQHNKNTIQIDLFFKNTVKEFLLTILWKLSYESKINLAEKNKKWLNFALKLKQKYPILPQEPPDDSLGINPYYFLKNLYSNLNEHSCLIFDAGGSFYSICQSFYPKNTQRVLGDNNNASMYYMIPAAIGTSFARNKGEVVGVCGDGSFSGMLQELETIKYHNLPIKLFIINNNGYNSLKKTQENFFGARYLAINEKSGISFPDISRVATCFQIPYFKIEKNKYLETINFIMKIKGPTVCEIICPPDMNIQPTIGSRLVDGKIQSYPLWNMSPFLPDEEINQLLEEIKNL